MSGRSIGARILRTEDPRLLRGHGEFVDDIRLAGTLHAAFLRSTHAHARVLAIDASAALQLLGVHAVLTFADMTPTMRTKRLPALVPNPYSKNPLTPFCLAKDEVSYVGEPIAIVIADSRHRAEDAAALIQVEYELLPAVADCRAAMKERAVAHQGRADNEAARFKVGYGDVTAAFASAAHVFKEELFHHRGCGHALETRGVLAERNTRDGLTLWSSTQTPHLEKGVLAEFLELGPDKLRVVAPDVGGGFGPKAIFYGEDAVVAVAAMKLKCPVKWIEDRREHFLSTTQERDQYWSLEIALDKDAKLLGVRGEMLHDTGAYLPWGVVMPFIAATTLPGPYVLAAYELEVTVAYTNKVATTPVRGAGRPQAVFAMERLLDRAARELHLDPAEIRARNLIQKSQMPYAVGLVFRDGKPVVYDSGDYPATLEKALALAEYRDFARRQEQARKKGCYIGIGIGSYVEGTGLGPFEGVSVRVLENGKIDVRSGAAPQGQGHKTMLAQIVSDDLGVPFDSVQVTLGDTGAFPMGVGTFASRITANAGPSASAAAKDVRQQVLALAARVLETAESNLAFQDGAVTAATGNRPTISLGELARIAQGYPGFSFAPGQMPGLAHTAYFTPPQAAYCNGTHIAEVEVDAETGAVRILRYTVAHDSGTLINPLIVDGQIQGGVAHGIGNALFEWMAYDSNAQPMTVTFADYLLATANEIPAVQAAHLETPSPLNPLGAKGAGEGGTIPAAAAIIAAVENALSPFGVKFADVPLTPDKIIAALRQSGGIR
ncbi:MAG TPA: xanthine dehydrogenase family protein molybdopterin-binding subunit [Micropepsaceae bacterium]|nr:xanthine dehydrogenase family protein molybdopterin-binding subunit [Micropepsaceae bacterium]